MRLKSKAFKHFLKAVKVGVDTTFSVVCSTLVELGERKNGVGGPY